MKKNKIYTYTLKSYDKAPWQYDCMIIEKWDSLKELQDKAIALKKENNKDYFIVSWYYQVWNTKDWDNENIFFN